MKNSSSASGSALLLLPYPAALSLQTISSFYCKAAVLPRSPLLRPDFQIPCTRETHSENARPTGAPGHWEPGQGAGPRTRPAPGRGAGMRAPPEVPQSRRGRKGRASGRSRPGAAVTDPARAPPPPRRQAAPPPQPGPRVLPGPRCSRRGERGARGAQLTLRPRRATLPGHPA